MFCILKFDLVFHKVFTDLIKRLGMVTIYLTKNKGLYNEIGMDVLNNILTAGF